MPYGLNGAMQTCQHALDEVLYKFYDCVDNYVDDVIVFSDDMFSHINNLQHVFKKLKSAGFTLIDSKCLLGQHYVTHHGFHYSAKRVAPSDEKIKTIAEWPVPQSAKEFRSFIAFANFYQNFVPGFANISKPGVHWPQPARTSFLKIDPVQIVSMRVCVCVCLCPRLLNK